MTTSQTAIQNLGQISVNATDIDRAVTFYRDVLELPLLMRFPGMAFFDCGGVRLYLAVAEKPEFAHTSILYFRVGDIHAAHAAMAARGAAFAAEPHKVHADARHELWLDSFTDSEGNHLALMSEVPVARG
jgi:predicted enzyme related to lactoylglutathione lyase